VPRFIIALLCISIFVQTCKADQPEEPRVQQAKVFQKAMRSESIVELQGYLVDAKSMKEARTHPKPEAFLQVNTNKLSTSNEFYLYYKEKWLVLDDRGNELAARLVKSSSLRYPLVLITGQLASNTIFVKKIEDISLQNKSISDDCDK